MRPEIQKKIAESKKTGKLHLAHMKINDGEIPAIMEAIKQVLPHVSVINLDNNQLGDKAAHILGDTLPDFHYLKELSLQYNKIGKDGAIAVFSLKNEIDDLVILFHGNKIANVGEMAEIEQVARRSGLTGF